MSETKALNVTANFSQITLLTSTALKKKVFQCVVCSLWEFQNLLVANL